MNVPLPLDNLPVLVSHSAIVLVWIWATSRLWKIRNIPHVNSAIAAGCAMIIARFLVLVETPIPQNILIYFVAMAHLTLVISFCRVLEYMMPGLRKKKKAHSKAIGLGLSMLLLSGIIL